MRGLGAEKTAVGQVDPGDRQDEIQGQVAQERRRLLQASGLNPPRVSHYRRPVEQPFTKAERDRVTLLFGGLTVRQERLIHAAVTGLGYKVERLPVPTKADYQTGREYCNYGMCSPAYFTAGALVNYLKRLRDEQGLSVETVLRDYAYVTAGSCGPCRFGAYESEYRLALRNSGFDGFRVITFQQKGGLVQSGDEAGLELKAAFFLSLFNAILIGDVLNELAFQIRPYETVPGQTDRVFEKVLCLLEERMKAKSYEACRGRMAARIASATLGLDAREVERYLDQLLSSYYLDTLRVCAQIIDSEIEVDYLRPKPLCKIIGEFWAQTTEGDGNFRMFSFLESQGAEVFSEPVTTWINYLIDYARNKREHERGVEGGLHRRRPASFFRKITQEVRRRKQLMALRLAAAGLHREYDRIREALGGTTHPQADQVLLRRLAHTYYNTQCSGGEGHLEIAKNIYYTTRHLAHMTLGLKPFGCLPSTQSDGAQAAVLAHHPDILYLPIETSGEGDVNAYSRVLMGLGEAKNKCKEEFERCVAQTGYTLEAVRVYCGDHPELRRPLQRIPQQPGVVGKAANFVLYVAARMNAAKGRCMQKRPRARILGARG